MGVIRCPKCRLINRGNAYHCRRCGTPLSSGNAEPVISPGPEKPKPAPLHWAIPIILIISLAGIYGFYRHSEGVSNSDAGPSKTNMEAVQNAPASEELNNLQKLSRDFIAQMDRNTTSGDGDDLGKNRALAHKMLLSIEDQQSKLNDAAALKYLNEFKELLGKYYDQLGQFDAETARLTEMRQSSTDKIENIKKDSSLSAEEKTSQETSLRTEVLNQLQERNVIAGNINNTVKALRSLSASKAVS